MYIERKKLAIKTFYVCHVRLGFVPFFSRKYELRRTCRFVLDRLAHFIDYLLDLFNNSLLRSIFL